jgi:hypothetical protein
MFVKLLFCTLHNYGAWILRRVVDDFPARLQGDISQDAFTNFQRVILDLVCFNSKGRDGL